MVEDVSGVMRGVWTPAGSSPAVSASFSASIWRARKTSVPSLNTTVMMDRPSMDSERSDSMSPRPLTIVSTGQRDEHLDLLGRQTGRLGLDHDLRLDEVREDVELGVLGHVQAVAEKQAGHDHHHAAVLEGELDECLGA